MIKENYLLRIFIGFLVTAVILLFPRVQSCSLGICDDPRACRIEWDDGSVQYKSRVIELGTLGPGESITVNLFDPNDISSIMKSPNWGKDNQTWIPDPILDKKAIAPQ